MSYTQSLRRLKGEKNGERRLSEKNLRFEEPVLTISDRLVKLAEYEGRSLSNLIAHLLERNIEVKLRAYQVAGEKVPKV